MHICTKRRGDTMTRVYRLPRNASGDVQELELVDALGARGQVTGADATPEGDTILLTTYDSLWLFEQVDSDRPLSRPVRWLRFSPTDGDVEAVCSADNDALLLGAEAAKRIYEAPLMRFGPPAL